YNRSAPTNYVSHEQSQDEAAKYVFHQGMGVRVDHAMNQVQRSTFTDHTTLKVEVKCNNRTIVALLDSGACCNIGHESILNPKTASALEPAGDTKFILADGSTVY